MIIDMLLLPRIKEIKLNICDLIKQCGVNTDKITLLDDKIEYAKKRIKKKDKLMVIHELYQDLIVIRNRIFNYYLYLLEEILEKYYDDIKYADIYQEACLTFLIAIEKFDAKKYNFREYISSVIKYNINYHYHDLDLCVSIPVNKRHEYYKMYKIIHDYVNKEHKMPKIEYLMKKLNTTKNMILLYLSFVMDDAMSLSDCLFMDDEYIKMDEIVSNNGDIRDLEDKAIDDNFDSLLDEVFNELTYGEQRVIYDYYLADDKIKLGQIVKKLGVSYKSGVNYKYRALVKLKKYKNEFGKYLR